MEFRAVPYDHPDAEALIEDLQQEYVHRYGGRDTTPVDPAEFAPPGGIFVIGYDDDGKPLGCGGWRTHDGSDPDLLPGDVELKRMYVAPRARGQGHSRALLAELERTAAVAGLCRMVLHTGTQQPEALALYASSGYTPIPGFGHYRDAPDGRYFSKPLRQDLLS
ncbi:GNAT family N-acetyltransferase [Actinopolymorpha alba]|uniref:GNAT family N-acetyltransferase n=1 Tax=Actinopolymorpha alba TaxID=533267 RepID=UPI00058DF40B|nr:GNAT family N-acetyltransferase [Actinopolymorpha alba]